MQKNDDDLPIDVPINPISSDYLADAIPGIVLFDKSGEITARRADRRDYIHPEIAQAWNELMDE